MDNVSIILYVCIVIPFLLVLPVLDKKGKRIVLSMAIGLSACLICTFLNQAVYSMLGESKYYYTTTVSPVIEEFVKAIPILIFAFVISDELEDILPVSFSLGVGFAVLENAILFIGSLNNADYIWAVARGFGAGLMHSICTMGVGLGLSYVKKDKKIFYSGTFALLSAAITYHAIFNTLVQSYLMYLGLLLPILTYLPVNLILIKKKRSA